MAIKPLGNRVLIKACEAKDVTIGGIVLPDSAKEKPQEAEVVVLGTGGKDEKGNDITFDVAVGNLVLTSQYGGTIVKEDGEEYKIVNAEDILAIVE